MKMAVQAMDVADGPSSGGGGEEDGGVDMMMDRVAAGGPRSKKKGAKSNKPAETAGDESAMEVAQQAAGAVMTDGERAFVEALFGKWGDNAFAYRKMASDESINVTGEPAGKIKRLFVKYKKLVGPLGGGS